MTRRSFLGSAAAIPALRAQAKRPPNIVLFLADDLGFNDTGWQNPDVRTPHLDRLCARGVKLSRYYTNSVCSPTRASLHTGRTCFRVGVPDPVPRNEALPLTEKLLPGYLAAAGYQTWLLGKWHLGDITPAHWPHRRGYQHHYGFLGGMIDYHTHVNQNRLDWFRNGEPVTESGYSTDLLANEALRLLRQRDPERPFFLNLSFNAPHTPLQAPESNLANFAGVANANRRAYLALIESMDAAAGRVYAALEEEGLANDTLVIFASDNGGPTGAGGASNAPLRGLKSGAFEGSLRVPAFLHWPDGLEGGWTFDRMFTVLDWLPTLATVAGFTPDPTIPLDGLDLWRFIRDGAYVERGTVLLGGGANYALFRDDWKLVQEAPVNNAAPRQSLFRLSDDPLETTDLAARHPDVRAELDALLRAQVLGDPDRAP